MTKNWACLKTSEKFFEPATNRRTKTTPRTDVRTLEHLFDGCEHCQKNFGRSQENPGPRGSIAIAKLWSSEPNLGELRGFDQDGAQSGKILGRESTVDQIGLYAAVVSFEVGEGGHERTPTYADDGYCCGNVDTGCS